MRKSFFGFSILVGALGLMGLFSLSWAQPPAISIDLTFDKTFYQFGEPVGVTVVVRNNSGEDLLISKGFSSKVYYLEMRVIDPAGRLLIVRNIEEPTELSDPPLLPFVRYQGQVIRVGRCEVLLAGWSSDDSQSRTDDLRAYYPMGLPGYYSAEVQVSAMTFKEAPCNVNDYKWLGVLKSETKYFYMEGATEVDIIPKWWRLPWKDGRYLVPDIAVTVWPQEGKTVDDYNMESIKLNTVGAKRVEKMYSFLKKKHYLLALFKKQEAINSLGPVEVGQSYPVVISGRLKSGEPFGGGEKVRITR